MPKQTDRSPGNLISLITEKTKEDGQSIILTPENYLRPVHYHPFKVEKSLSRIRNRNVYCCFAIGTPVILGYLVAPEDLTESGSWVFDYPKLTPPRKLEGSPIRTVVGEAISRQRIAFPYVPKSITKDFGFEYRVCSDIFCQTTNNPDLILVSAYVLHTDFEYRERAPAIVNDSQEEGAMVLTREGRLVGDEAADFIQRLGLELILE